jgi:hypothetical protein
MDGQSPAHRDDDEWMDHHSGRDEWMDIIVAGGWQVDKKHFFIGFPFP